MIRQFLLVWIWYWAAVAALPVHSIYPATSLGFLLQAAFVAIVASTAKGILDIFQVRRLPATDRYVISDSSSLIWIAMLLSLAGFAALIYDKLYIQHIDYSEGVAFAREEWRRIGDDREGHASSIFSVVGYLLGSSYYVAVILAITQGSRLSIKMRLTTVVLGFFLLMANSLLIGGRSNVLLLGTFVAGAFGSRQGITFRGLFASTAQRRLLRLLIGLALAYCLYIFFQRAGEVAGVEYALDFLPFLGLEADAWFRHSLGGTALSSLSAIAVLGLSYITHSFASVAAIMDAPIEDKSLVFLNVHLMLYKLGFAAQPDDNWILQGRFPSVPGALWHQFGPMGFFAGSVLLGCAAGAAKAWQVRKPDKLVPLGAYTMITATLLLTPVLFAPDFLSFPFVFVSFVILSAIGRVLKHIRVHHRDPANREASVTISESNF